MTYLTNEGGNIKTTSDLTSDIMQARQEWGAVFNALREKTHKSNILCSAKLSFGSEKERKKESQLKVDGVC